MNLSLHFKDLVKIMIIMHFKFLKLLIILNSKHLSQKVTFLKIPKILN